MAKATVGVSAFLRDDHFIRRKKGQGYFAILRLAGNERRDVAVDSRFTNCLANVRVTIARHPLAVELDLQLMLTECEHAKVVAGRFVDAIDLSGSDNSSR